MTASYLDLVEDFHRVFKYKHPTPTEPDLTRELILNRTAYLREEFNEYTQAKEVNDRVEILDGLVDMKYISCGSVLAFGIRSQFDRWRPVTAGAHEMEIPYYSGIIEDTLRDFAAVMAITSTEASAMCFDTDDSIGELVHAHGFHDVFIPAFHEVHVSNMRKLWTDAQVAAYGAMPHIGEPYRFQKTDGGWIATDATGKIKKPFGWIKPDLAQFVK